MYEKGYNKIFSEEYDLKYKQNFDEIQKSNPDLDIKEIRKQAEAETEKEVNSISALANEKATEKYGAADKRVSADTLKAYKNSILEEERAG